MSATGIGASVKRKEDIRFITGKGHYVDDINRPGQAYAVFVRSPHAHATIDKIDASAALKSAGRRRDLHRRRHRGRQDRRASSAASTVHSKDGSPMKAGAFPALAQGKVRYVGDHVAVVIADTYAQARDAAEKIVVDYGVLPAVVDTASAAQAGPAANSRRRAQQHGLQLASRRQGVDRCGLRRSRARHEARSRQQPDHSQRDGAARGARRL